MITSKHNPKVQWVRELQVHANQRKEQQVFVVEGVRLVEEALLTGQEVRLVFHTGDLDERGQGLIAGFAERGFPVEEVIPQVMRAVSDTQTPQGILAVLPIPRMPMPKNLSLVFIPDGVRDPGNLGSMLRTAAAAGVDVVFLPPGTVDGYAPKVVRAAMGAHFRLPVRSITWEDIRSLVREAGLQVFLAEAGSGQIYTRTDFRSPLALVVGGEAEGASEAARELAEDRVSIPLLGGVESLNAGIAAAVLLFEVVRQRSGH
jgi:TrmH family RNA methyltransferase